MADDMAPSSAGPPPGFVRSEGRGPFMTHNGPFYHREHGDAVQQAFFADAQHANGIGLVHGGMLSAFMDGLMASALLRTGASAVVTMHLSIDYLGMARVGEWIIGEARCTRLTREVGFAEARVLVGERAVARGTGVFKVMRRAVART
jgi:uncharacterized protein (TIGR00369 family)